MSKSDLYKSAIAEARELKEISMAQAKQQIAESFAPRIQEMFAAKVNEMDAMDEEEDMKEGMNNMDETSSMEEVNETSLDEILAELDAESNMHEGDDLEEGEDLEEGQDLEEKMSSKEKMEKGLYNEKKDDDKEDDKPAAPKADAEDEEGDGGLDLGADNLDGMGSDLGGEGAEEVAELSVEEFKNLVRDVVADVLAGHNGSDAENLDGDAAGMDMDAPAEGGDSFSLDEILEQLEKEGLEEGEDEMMEGDKMEEGKDDELEEAIKTIEELKSTINEMNLFNAKLLYTNKIFEAKSLSNSQKTKVLSAFDKASTLNEVKAVYKTLATTLDSTQKAPLKESLGFASKAMGGAPAKPILEENAYVSRFQQLAGIKKLY